MTVEYNRQNSSIAKQRRLLRQHRQKQRSSTRRKRIQNARHRRYGRRKPIRSVMTAPSKRSAPRPVILYKCDCKCKCSEQTEQLKPKQIPQQVNIMIMVINKNNNEK